MERRPWVAISLIAFLLLGARPLEARARKRETPPTTVLLSLDVSQSRSSSESINIAAPVTPRSDLLLTALSSQNWPNNLGTGRLVSESSTNFDVKMGCGYKLHPNLVGKAQLRAAVLGKKSYGFGGETSLEALLGGPWAPNGTTILSVGFAMTRYWNPLPRDLWNSSAGNYQEAATLGISQGITEWLRLSISYTYYWYTDDKLTETDIPGLLNRAGNLEMGELMVGLPYDTLGANARFQLSPRWSANITGFATHTAISRDPIYGLGWGISFAPDPKWSLGMHASLSKLPFQIKRLWSGGLDLGMLW